MVTHVQTEVDEETYNMLKRIALLKGKSLKEIVREAIDRYVKESRKDVESAIKRDSIWKAVGVFEVERDASEKDEWESANWQSE
jgi:hypothetical protein